MKRDRLILCAALLACALIGLAAGLTVQEMSFELRGYENPTRTADLPYRVPFIGINGDWLAQPVDELAAELARLRASNVSWLRQPISWAEIESERGNYRWRALDQLIEALQEQTDLHLVAWLRDPPVWLSAEQLPTEFARFAGDFAARYGAFVDHYQLGEWEESAERYRDLLAAAYPAIHEADPNARVVTAPLPSADDLIHLDELLSLSANQYWDTLALSPGAFESQPSDRRVAAEIRNFSRLILHRELLRKHGDGRKAIWLMNLAWQGATAAEHNAYTLAALQRAQREWPWLGVNFLPQDAFEESTLQDSLAEWQRDLPQDGLFPVQHGAMRYTGEWTFQDDAADYGRAVNSELRLNFWGSEVALLLGEDAWHTVLYTQIDEAAPAALPAEDQERGYIILTSADRNPRLGLTTVARQLPLAEHELRLIGGGGDTRYALRGVGISSGDLAEPYRLQLSIAAAAGVISIAFAFGSAIPILRPLAPRIIALRGQLRTQLAEKTDAQPLTHRAAVGGYLLASLGYVLLQAQFAIPITLLSALLIGALCRWRRELGLALILLALPFQRYPIALGGFLFPPAELLLALTVAAELLVRLSRWPDSWRAAFTARYRWLDVLTIIWVLLGALSLYWARWPAPALTEWRALLLEPALFFALLRLHARHPLNQQRLITALLAGAGIVAALGIIMLVNGTIFATAEAGVRRLVSVYGSPNHAALFLGRCLPFSLVLAIAAPSARIRQLSTAVTLLLLAAALLTQSFAALFLGLPAGILVVTFVSRHRQARYLAAGMVMLIFAAILLGGRLQPWWNWGEGSLFLRTNVWQSALRMLADEPIRGFGLDQFLYAYRDTYIAPDAWRDPDLSHPHNIILDLWLRMGILGLALFALLQWQFWRRLLPTLHPARARDGWPHLLALALAGAMASLLLHGMVDNSIFLHDLAFLFALMMAFSQTDRPGQQPIPECARLTRANRA